MWSGDLAKEDCKRINTRVLGTNGLELPPELEGKQISKIFQIGINWFNLIPYNVNTSLYFSRRCMVRMSNKQGTKFHRSSSFSRTYASNTPKCNLQRNATGTYSNNWGSYNQLYTITTQQRINRHLRHCIITSCGDATVMMGSKHIDPALCIYIGAYLICIDNKHLRDKVPWGNGT